MQPWRTTNREIVFQPGGGRYLTVESHRVELPSGQVIDDWLWLDTPDFVNVVIETTDGDFVCFRQTKYAVEGTSLAIVGGYVDAGEDPRAAAERETAEETGYLSDDWTDLGSFAVDGNRGAGTAHFFFARGASVGAPLVADDLEEQELVLLSRAELQAAVTAGEFKVVTWAAAVSLALLAPPAPSSTVPR